MRVRRALHDACPFQCLHLPTAPVSIDASPADAPATPPEDASATGSPGASSPVDPISRLKTLKQELELVKSERVRLEALNEERAELRAKLDQLESETQDSKNEAAAIARRIETERGGLQPQRRLSSRPVGGGTSLQGRIRWTRSRTLVRWIS